MRSSWALNPTRVSLQEKKENTIREDNEEMKADTGVIHLQDKECQGPLTTDRS